jgi:hypothetical protein
MVRISLTRTFGSVSSSLLEGYDEPEILRSSITPICPMGADAGQFIDVQDAPGFGIEALPEWISPWQEKTKTGESFY